MASLNSGIAVSEKVSKAFADPSIQAIQIKIDGESFVLGLTSLSSTWPRIVEEIQAWLSQSSPQYICLKVGHPSTNSLWTLLQLTPDAATVREKMMYSSSKSLLMKHIPVNQKDLWQVFATDAKELSAKGLDSFARSSDAPNPLSDLEKEKQMHQYQEASAAIGLSTRTANASNLLFELTQQAISALKTSFVSGSGVVALGIQDEKTVLIAQSSKLHTMEDICRICPPEQALFVFFTLASKDELGFAYVSPPTCKIKERMLFAASRQTVISQVEGIIQVSIKKKYEVDSVEEILVSETETIADQTTGSNSKLLFSRPKRPGN